MSAVLWLLYDGDCQAREQPASLMKEGVGRRHNRRGEGSGVVSTARLEGMSMTASPSNMQGDRGERVRCSVRLEGKVENLFGGVSAFYLRAWLFLWPCLI